VVGFNTGKYDVNAMKVDFFTRLVDSPFIREEPFLFCTLVGFPVLAVTKSRGNTIADIDKLQLFEEIQQRLDQDLEEYKDDEEREREEKKHHLYQLKQQLEQYPTRTSRGWFQHGEI
jgi:hypothetical protein